MLNLIIDCGADVNKQDSNGWTPLHHAAHKGDINSIQLLIMKGAKVNMRSNKGRTSLHLAALNNHLEVVKYLLNQSSQKDAPDNQKCTPLMLAALRDSLQVVHHLLYAGANYIATDFRKWTALHYASFNGHPRIVNKLIKWDADNQKLFGIKDCHNKRAFDIVKDQETKFGFFTLWKAAADGDLDLVRQLIDRGENINQATEFQKTTPLHQAAIFNRHLVVRYLLEKGASNDAIDKEGCTPLEQAEKRSYKVCANLIIESMKQDTEQDQFKSTGFKQ